MVNILTSITSRSFLLTDHIRSVWISLTSLYMGSRENGVKFCIVNKTQL